MFSLQFVQVLAPLPIGFAVFMVHMATLPITGTGINPARSFGAAVIYNRSKPWDDQVSGSLWVHLARDAVRNILVWENKLIFFVDSLSFGAVDLLGRSISGRCIGCLLSPVRLESRPVQKPRVLQKPRVVPKCSSRVRI